MHTASLRRTERRRTTAKTRGKRFDVSMPELFDDDFMLPRAFFTVRELSESRRRKTMGAYKKLRLATSATPCDMPTAWLNKNEMKGVASIADCSAGERLTYNQARLQSHQLTMRPTTINARMVMYFRSFKVLVRLTISGPIPFASWALPTSCKRSVLPPKRERPD